WSRRPKTPSPNKRPSASEPHVARVPDGNPPGERHGGLPSAAVVAGRCLERVILGVRSTVRIDRLRGRGRQVAGNPGGERVELPLNLLEQPRFGLVYWAWHQMDGLPELEP